MRSPTIVVVLLWLAVLLDGFDMVVLGATLPAMMEDPNWQLTAAQGTQISTAGLIGMTIGALVIGAATDKLGRRNVMIVSVAAFSILTLIMGFTYNFWAFLILRFFAGVGLGGCLPTAISMVTEFRGRSRAGSSTTTVMTGYHVGAVLTALLGIFVIGEIGWHSMYIIGAVPGLILAPVMYFLLPESPQYLNVVGRTREAQDIADTYGLELADEMDRTAASENQGTGIKALLKPPYLRNSLAIWAGSFMGLLLVYGLNTWLPQIMRQADYDMGNSLGFLMVLNIGAVVGLVIAGRVSDRYSPRPTAMVWFLLSAIFLSLMAVRMPMIGLYIIVFLTGIFVFSSQNLVYAFVGENHPSNLRATAMGLSAGIGRLGAISGPMLGGLLISLNMAHPWGFFAYGAVGLAGAIIFMFTRPIYKRTVVVAEQPLNLSAE
ncbi:MFS transporter [Corynebacterium cystitidis]|uniref:Benzoate transport n=1 Tax=Corynebacterium cystitidis DSM 20524 TaxID=1121357 RepID=A0A1H9SPV2_9CORY|nr:aromatic acid/H+ symport family MFS transporter [Corynebacterium cystitidis]WJY83129.1 4-hydroxybenzoate transporter PcaK [Corynebacterium cystitidis DSM 20524]SER86961.1 benzoate transport [Corynebacterium cystitidis DSM 20524]SNV66583.1 permease of the major facilitator superfamily [Corynebacterium cystitidis]